MKSSKRGMAWILAAALFISPITPLGFFDKEQAHGASWADPFMNNLVDQKILRGDEDGDLRPDDSITRAEFLALTNRTFGFDQKGNTSFSDVFSQDWYADDVSIGAQQGYFAGIGEGKAGPNDNLTREQAVSLLCRAVKIEPLEQDTLKFNDANQFNNWAKGSINSSTSKGFIAGKGDGSFKPQSNITRAEVSVILTKMSGRIINEPRQARLGYVNGNVTLTESGAGLRDTVIAGDLYITEGVGAGHVLLENVTVLGQVIISGAGESNVGDSSIRIENCDIKDMIINVGHGKTLSVIATGQTKVDKVTVRSNTFLEEKNTTEYAFVDVNLSGPEKTKLDLSGDFEKVNIMAAKNLLNLRKGSIDRLTVDETAPESEVFLEKDTYTNQVYADVGTTIKGQGKIDYIVINAPGTKVEQLPDNIIIRPGVEADINGKTMTSQDAEVMARTPELSETRIEERSPTGATAYFEANKPGKVYWVVKAIGSAEPSIEDLKKPKEATNIVVSGNLGVINDKETNAKIGSLKSGEYYAMYTVLEDMKSQNSRMKKVTFQTIDNVNPAMIGGYPKAIAVAEKTTEGAIKPDMHKFTIEAVPTKTGTIYWAILPSKSIAPTVDDLLEQKVPGNKNIGTIKCIKNEMTSNFVMTGKDGTSLNESADYDMYMAIKDDSGNKSSLFKVSGKTKDVTQPEFIDPYPMMGAVGPTSVQMKYATDEKSTLYWAAYKRGAPMPPSSPTAIDRLKSKEAQQMVMTGNGSLSFGKVSTTEGKEGNFSISGLKVQTPYDIYFVLEDASLNRSVPVIYKPILTKDDILPTAEMIFDETQISEEGNPPVGSDIRIKFSEEVHSGLTQNNTKLADITPKSDLKKNIKLYNLSVNPIAEVPIDFGEMKFEQEENQTILVFSTKDKDDSSPAAIKMASGNTYRFELSGITDYSKNKMRATNTGGVSRLPEFKTMAPFVKITEKSPTTGHPHIIIEIEPKVKNAGEDLYFDNVLETNQNIIFDMKVEEEKDGNKTILHDAKNLMMDKDKFYVINALIKGVQTDYKKFNDLGKMTVSITIKTLGTSNDESTWSSPLTITARSIAGDGNQIRETAMLGDKGTYESQASKLPTVIVSDKSKLDCTKYFSDTMAPAFVGEYPKLYPGDNNVKVEYQLNKKGTVYWLIAPKGKITRMPTAPELINGTISAPGSKKGKVEVTSGNVVFEDMIKDLNPDRTAPDGMVYELYYTAKTNVPSEVFKKMTTLTAITAPVYMPGFPTKGGGTANGAEVKIQLDPTHADAQVYWVVYEENLWSVTPTSIQISEVYSDTVKQPIASGNLIIKKDELNSTTVNIRNLREDTTYEMFIAMRNPLSTIGWVEVARVSGITASDSTAPSIVKEASGTTISYPGELPFRKFSGSVTVMFSEPLRYKETLAGDAKDLDAIVLENKFIKAIGSGLGETSLNSAYTQTGDAGITGFIMDFKKLVPGTTLTLPYIVVDRSGNVSGKLTMKFILDKNDPLDSYWDVKFAK